MMAARAEAQSRLVTMKPLASIRSGRQVGDELAGLTSVADRHALLEHDRIAEQFVDQNDQPSWASAGTQASTTAG